MLSSLGKINNPLVRSIAAASTSLAMATLIAAVTIGLTDNTKDKSANKIGIYASLLAFVAGGSIGLVIKNSSAVKSKPATKQESAEEIWRDWRDFKVVRKESESKEIASFYFQPVDGKKLVDFKPGQFLTIKLDIPEQDRPIIRTYSLSDYPESQDYYRLSIKREGSPKGLDVPPGVASNFMHDSISEGSTIACKPPSGKFYLDVDNSLPVVLISNGVGITPMISMAKAVARKNPQRHVWFLHGARNRDYHACYEEVKRVAESCPNLHIHYRYSRPRPEDEGLYDSQGYVDKQLLTETIIPEIESTHNGSSEAEYFLCGSPAFMNSLREGLDELNVAEDNVFFESFSGGKTKGKTQLNDNEQSIDSAKVTFTRSDKTLTWTPKDGTLLEFAEANDLNPEFSCRQGVCLTCMCQIQEGEVEYIEEPSGEPDEGEVLICISKPKTSKIVLDL